MKSSLEIAQGVKLKPISKIAKKIGLKENDLDLYGPNIAKLSAAATKRVLASKKKDGKLILVTAIIFFTLLFFSKNINASNLTTYDSRFLLYPFGVVMFALLGFSSVPEMRIEIMKKESLLRKAIIAGTIFPLILYSIFTFTFLGTFGKNVSEVATLSFGNFVPVLGVFTMFASYFVLSFSLKNIFDYLQYLN